ncbi:dihydroneopterin aldolase [Ottowia sp.]|uniref:dihydroneopterin aldolase n=1 Tax=Ottowia sp. TaxID=1898956 RepID=UPI003A84A386
MNDAMVVFAALDRRLALECRTLILRDYAVQVRIGIHDFERATPQRMLFDVDLCVPLDHAPARHDDIGQTLDYDFLRTLIARLAHQTHFEIQETLCDAILNELLTHPQVQAARVTTRKPDVYPDCAAVGTQRVGIKP